MTANRVFVTGATGFVGSHVVRALRDAGYPVTALVRDASVTLSGVPQARSRRAAITDESIAIDWIEGDLRNPGFLTHALRDCRYVVHCAARYSFAPSERAEMHAINVTGTAGVIEAAHVAGVERVVLTSSSATVGHARSGTPATEADVAGDDDSSAYHHSKLEQERAAFAGRAPVIAVLPTAPVGEGDWKPTPTGAMILEFARGKMFAKPPGDGGMNVVDVRDVARAHVAALERGRPGERYLVGGENVSFDHLWSMLAEITGKPAPRHRVPYALALAIAYGDEARCRVVRGAVPFAPLEGVRMSRARMYVDCAKARAELGYQPGPIYDALRRSVEWYRANGYL